jgi:hypothetical protein
VLNYRQGYINSTTVENGLLELKNLENYSQNLTQEFYELYRDSKHYFMCDVSKLFQRI